MRPLEDAARFLGGAQPVAVVAAPADKQFDLSIVVPVEDLGALGQPAGAVPSGSASGAEERTSVWPHVEERLLELIRAHRTTIIFANSRRLAERLCARLNELAEAEVVRAHHGSVSREQRAEIEEALRAGRIPAVVATSSLELGIDMGAVDLVVQVEAPDSVATALQRVGRGGHQVGAVSRGVFFPKYRGDLLECAVVVERMRAGAIEALRSPRNPLDVLAQQIVAMVAMDDWTVDGLERVVERASAFAELPRAALDGVLDMLAGRYPADVFAELRPRINWDRTTQRLEPRPQAQRLAVTSGGTIPDRGLYGVFLAGEHPTRVGELDEEMVYESRVGDVFLLGASSWRIEDITHDRVIVSPAPGKPGKMPFWHGDALGRPLELGAAVGRFVRELGEQDATAAHARLRDVGLDDWAAGNLLRYLAEQREATGAVPDDRTLGRRALPRRGRRLARVRPLVLRRARARAVGASHRGAAARAARGHGAVDVHRRRHRDPRARRRRRAACRCRCSSIPRRSRNWSPPRWATRRCSPAASASARRARCSCRDAGPARARRCGSSASGARRSLQVASRHPGFPILLETYRECLQDVFDLPELASCCAVRRRDYRVVEVETELPSPFAGSLQLRLRQRLHVRGRRAARRAARAGAVARSVAARAS